MDETVGQMAARAEAEGGETVAAHRPVGGGRWVPETWASLGRLRRGIAAGLVARGVQRGDRVAILSHTRWEWGPIDTAVLTVGAVTVGIYPTSTPAQVEYILRHSGAKLLFIESEAQRARLAAVLGAGLEVVVIDGGLAAFLRDGDPNVEVRGTDLATLVYTSGTTGPPKAVALTHQNLLATSRLGTQYLGAKRGDLAVSYLPMAHVLTRVNYYGYLQVRGCAFHSESLEKVNEAWLAARPVMVAAVPRVLEKVQARILDGVAASRPLRRRLFARALKVGERVLDLRQAGKPVPALLRWEAKLWQRLVGAKLRAKLGWQNVRYVLCGGAPARLDVLRFFHALGIVVLEGFGMTETSSPVTLNHPTAFRLGTVGRALPGIEVRVADDGELLVRSPGLFRSYEGDDASTSAAFEEGGWFKTGDVGEIDADGFVKITDRKKDLIITGGGKNVAPQNIEALVRADARVSQVVAIGDARPYLVALVTLQPGAPASAAAEAIACANAQLAPYETIKKHVVVAEDFSVENELLTPTLKVKRRAVAARYAREIERLYAS
ncbi:MAG: long-chain fatty acid--CoA ligase [Myxococcaceae bacterium]|nr:long-chain fatty acid--CoA ligase [Myxococcaceae bacterium]